MPTDYTKIPELAGIATYADAARVGYSVEDNVARLLRFHWVERRLMHALIAHLPATPVWEVKCALALHQWYCAQHADALRTRITEMRSPAPALDRAPDAALNTFLAELLRAADVVELVAGVYDVALPALRDAYAGHSALTNPLCDHPTLRLLHCAREEVDDALEWGTAALAALLDGNEEAAQRADRWRTHLSLYLAAAGGITGETPRPTPAELPPPRAAAGTRPDMEPRRDERFGGSYNFNFPPHVVYSDPAASAEERNLALLCKRTLEMDVPEMMASFLTETEGEPWDFYLRYSRQLWDEARHAMMGTVAFTARGVDWTRIPLNVGFSLRLNLHATPHERQLLLYAIEQSLMPADVGKRSEYETAVAAGDELSAHFHDYDWADEVLHAQIGRRALKRQGISPEQATERAEEIHARTWAALDRYKSLHPQEEWWPAFVRQVLGKESALDPQALARDPTVVSG
jgi:hypothetical protein